MPWTLLATKSPPPVGSEAWDAILIAPLANVALYGFRMGVAQNTPESYSSVGFAALAQVIEGRAVSYRSFRVQLIGRGAGQHIRAIDPNDGGLIATPDYEPYIVYMYHRWIVPTNVELWGYVRP